MSANRLSLIALAPVAFVLLWSTGWIVAKFSDPHSGPLTFLFIRFCLSVVVFAVLSLALSSRWPRDPLVWMHAFLSGLFLHAVYLGGIWWAIEQGVPTSVSGVLAALQPLLTALLAWRFIGEDLTRQQKAGLALGFLGLLVVIGPDLVQLSGPALVAALIPLTMNAISMASVTIGTIYQKRALQGVDLVPIATLQYVGAAVFIVPAMLIVEPEMHMDWNLQSIGAMAWSVFGLSMGAILLLLMLIGRGQVSRAASLIYLIPPTVALEAWLFFGEDLSLPLLVGTAIVVTGVWLVNRKPKPSHA